METQIKEMTDLQCTDIMQPSNQTKVRHFFSHSKEQNFLLSTSLPRTRNSFLLFCSFFISKVEA